MSKPDDKSQVRAVELREVPAVHQLREVLAQSKQAVEAAIAAELAKLDTLRDATKATELAALAELRAKVNR